MVIISYPAKFVKSCRKTAGEEGNAKKGLDKWKKMCYTNGAIAKQNKINFMKGGERRDQYNLYRSKNEQTDVDRFALVDCLRSGQG